VKEILMIEAVALLAAGVLFEAAPKPREVEAVGTDYAFQIPSALPPGPTTFRFNNKGKKRHELNIFLLKPGATVTQVIELQKAGKSTQDLVEKPVGVLFAAPGGRSGARLLTDLVAGREYGVICIFQDTATAPRHYEMGMYSTIRVQKKKPALLATMPPADSIVGVDYAFSRYPKTLAPGKHTFVFKNEGKFRHEVSMGLLKPGVTIARVVEVDKAGGNVDALFDGAIGVLWSRPGETPLGRLDVDLLPGREYVIDCSFSNDDKSPPHYTLGMYGSIVVSGKPGA
jgi:uncharacterized cupredoxin-like copper-binding protein